MTCLSSIRKFACNACDFVNLTVYILVYIIVYFLFCKIILHIGTSEGNSYCCLFKYIVSLAHLRTLVCKCCPEFLSFGLCCCLSQGCLTFVLIVSLGFGLVYRKLLAFAVCFIVVRSFCFCSGESGSECMHVI